MHPLYARRFMLNVIGGAQPIDVLRALTKASKRTFLRRTKATAPPDAEAETTTIDNVDTSTSKFARRGGSKFKSRNEIEKTAKNDTDRLEKNELENRARRPSFNSGARRSERPVATRSFVRRRLGGASAPSSSTPAPSSVSTGAAVRRPFGIANRRRPAVLTPTTTTTTTPSPTTTTAPSPTTTNALSPTTTPASTAALDSVDIEESLQYIGDIDAIEDPTLELRGPNQTNKVQRRPLVTLKEEVKDQNPSATNEEEGKRQSKKYSSTFKQNQLDDLLRLKSKNQETTTEYKTTVEEYSAETALAIAAHQLLTAPLPSLPNFDIETRPTTAPTTQSYKYTSAQFNEFTDGKTPAYDEYTKALSYKTNADFVQTTSDDAYSLSQFDSPKISTNTFEGTNPITSNIFPTRDSGLSTISTIPTEFDSREISFTTFDIPKTTNLLSRNTESSGYSTLSTDFDSPKESSTDYDVTNIASITYPAKDSREFDFSTITSDYNPPRITPTYYDDPQSTINRLETKDSRQLEYETISTDFNSREETSTDAFDASITTSTVAKPSGFTTNPTDLNQREITATNFDVPRTNRFSTPTYNTVTQDYFETTSGVYKTPRGFRPRISTTVANTEPTTTSFTKRSRQRLSSPNIISTGYSEASQRVGSSTPRYSGSRGRYTTVPEEYGYSTTKYTGSSNDPSYFTREYLLESPVTKTYDEEYQYLLPITTPQTSTRRIIRKKIQRRISTTLRPNPAPTTPAPTTTTTEKPRRVPTKKPFEKISSEPVRTYRPIINYDYYDDSEEKVAEKYEEGTKVVLHGKGTIECLDIGNFPHPTSCKKFISCARMEGGSILGWEYICPKGLSFDPVGSICNWSAGLGCDEKDV